jgi:hypothetical protein
MLGDATASARASWGRWLPRAGIALVLAVGAGLVGIDRVREARTRSALAEVRKRGGFYLREEGRRHRPVTCVDLDSTLVDDAGRVHRRGRATDATLAVLGRFERLQELSLDGADVTDGGLAALRDLRELRRLKLSRTRLTDAGLDHLKGLSALEWIDLRGTRVTAVGVAVLRRALPSAEVLADSDGPPEPTSRTDVFPRIPPSAHRVATSPSIAKAGRSDKNWPLRKNVLARRPLF